MPPERRGSAPEPSHDEEEVLERAITHDFYEVLDVAEDSHLEQDYDDRQSGDGDDY